ncbi:hypothetical protein GO988_11790 [Hymenobacter sp. HMF4947]|uniref:Uncharacterized protein n=1 Tax=Hymenobacter ginkgonis TaxID=2682976 RepID=A0A7K1TF39_9BACT|nr:hypothetical protein [Hymenobacter ginkgonis]MVN77008.1 hypothetical protein [Hymenobacter ginkgonis]
MKTISILGAALLGLASTSAFAQVVVAPGSATTPINGAGTVAPGQPNTVGTNPAGTMSTGVGVPIGTSPSTINTPTGIPGGAGTNTGTIGTGTLNNGTISNGTLDNGTLRSTQPAGVTTPTGGTRRATNTRTTTTRP